MRIATSADLAALTLLEREAFPDPWSADQIAGQLANPLGLTLLQASRSGETAAYAAFQIVADEAELLRICVLPGERRTGVAKRLLREGLTRLAEQNVHAVHLEVRADNHAAIGLYEDLQFTQVGERRAYYRDGSSAVLYRRELYAPARTPPGNQRS